MGLPRWHKVVRNPPASEGHKRPGVDPWWGRSPGAGNDSPLQCSCLESPMDREGLAGCGAGGAESGTRLSGRAAAAADVWLTRQSVQRQTATYLNARPINNRNRSLLI